MTLTFVPGLSLSTRMMIVWHRSKAKVDRLLGNAPLEARSAHESTCRFPCEIVEMIIAHFTRDLRTLKACSLTCRSWYLIAAPHLHHTLTLKGDWPGLTRGQLKPLSKLHKLGLMPLVKEILVIQWCEMKPWFGPQAFNQRDLRYFSAFTNVHTLRLQDLRIYPFISNIEPYFKQFSPTLRSITLFEPYGTPRQLSYFLSFFPNLDDIAIWRDDNLSDTTLQDTKLVQFSVPKLRGRLVLHGVYRVETWAHLATSCGGLQFRYLDLYRSANCAPTLLEACAETVQTLRFSPRDPSVGE